MTYRNLSKSLVVASSLLPLIASGAPVHAADGAAKADVSREQFETRHQTRFFKADKDGNKLVSKDEFFAAHTSGDATKLGKRFDRMDANHDGSIDPHELTTMLDQRFKRLDKDGNGMLSATERPAPRARSNG